MNAKLEKFWEHRPDWLVNPPEGFVPFHREADFHFTNVLPAAGSDHKLISIKATSTQVVVVEQILFRGFNNELVEFPYIGMKWQPLEMINFTRKMRLRMDGVACFNVAGKDWVTPGVDPDTETEGVFEHGLLDMRFFPIIGNPGRDVTLKLTVDDVTAPPLLSPDGAMIKASMRGFVTYIDYSPDS